ncbi:MAG: PAS domain S-box protein, partial [Verrucomicrobiota bacterium]
EAQARLQSGLSAGRVGTWIWDVTHDRLYADEFMAEIFSLSRAEAAGSRREVYLQAMHPDDRERNRLQTQEALLSGTLYEAEYRVKQRDDGGWRWYQARGKIERAADGKPTKLRGALIDITERKESEDALLRSESLLRMVTNEAHVGLVMVNREHRYLFANATYAEILGLPDANIVGKRVADVLPRIYDQVAIWLNDALAGKRVTYEMRLAMMNGSEDERVFEVVYEPGVGAGEPFVVVVVVDITQRKAAEDKLRESEQRLLALINGIPNLAWRANPDGGIFWYNDRWYEYTGTTSEQMEGWGWQRVHDPKILPAVLTKWRASIANGQPFEMIFPLRAANGKFGQFLTRVVPMRDVTGNIQFWFGTNTDITEQRETAEALALAQKELARHAERLEEQVSERTAQLQESLKTMENYNYSIAHDLRSPLRGMMGFADMLLEDYAPKLDDTGKDYLRRVKNNARRMDDLVRDLLEYGRLTHIDLPLEELDMELIVKRTLEDLASEIENRHAQIEIQHPLPVVFANPVLLSQILQNLVTNAIKFVPKGVVPHLTVRDEETKDWIRLWVEDNGLGIEPSHQKKIFEMFHRLHTQDIFPGTGIGLAIVKKGMERMGGKCGVESERGKGSRFWIEFPKVN